MEFSNYREIRKFIATAKKEHSCDTCGGIIDPGEKYFGTVIAFEDTLITSHDHMNCEEKEPTRKEWLEIEFADILNMFPGNPAPFALAG